MNLNKKTPFLRVFFVRGCSLYQVARVQRSCQHGFEYENKVVFLCFVYWYQAGNN